MAQTFEHDPAKTRRRPGFATTGEGAGSGGLPAPANDVEAPTVRAQAALTRLCVLCGEPLRGGQHMIRVHGSTIHARCSTTYRNHRARH